MLNRVVLVGRITKDPELRYTQTGIAVVGFTLAVNRPYADAQGERQADFIPCVAWRNQAENLAKHITQGALLGVEGRMQVRSYDTDQGKRYTTEVVCDSVTFLSSKTEDTSTRNEEDDFFEATSKLSVEDDLPF